MEIIKVILAIITMPIYIEIFLFVGVWTVVSIRKDIPISSHDEKIIVCMITYSLLGISKSYLEYKLIHTDIQYVLNVLMGITIMAAATALGLKLRQRLKNKKNTAG